MFCTVKKTCMEMKGAEARVNFVKLIFTLRAPNHVYGVKKKTNVVFCLLKVNM